MHVRVQCGSWAVEPELTHIDGMGGAVQNEAAKDLPTKRDTVPQVNKGAQI